MDEAPQENDTGVTLMLKANYAKVLQLQKFIPYKNSGLFAFCSPLGQQRSTRGYNFIQSNCCPWCSLKELWLSTLGSLKWCWCNKEADNDVQHQNMWNKQKGKYWDWNDPHKRILRWRQKVPIKTMDKNSRKLGKHC